MANVDTTRVAALLNEAAEAAASNLVPGLASGFVGDGTEPIEFVPGDGTDAVAVTARMSGLEGTMVLALSPALVAEILAGPTGAQGLVAAAELGLRAAAAVLDQTAPRALRLDNVQQVVALPLFEAAGDAWWFGAAPIFRGEEHLGSLALLLDEPVAGETDDDIIEVADTNGAELFTPALADGNGSGSFDPFAGADGNPAVHSLHLLRDVEMEVTVELGRTKMSVRNILMLTTGAVIELDRAAGAPVDLLVNGTLIGRGEVVVIDEEFGVRISEIIGRTDNA
jgi:flagellar motor switch protein FliN